VGFFVKKPEFFHKILLNNKGISKQTSLCPYLLYVELRKQRKIELIGQ